jgi:hypothetical protein
MSKKLNAVSEKETQDALEVLLARLDKFEVEFSKRADGLIARMGSLTEKIINQNKETIRKNDFQRYTFNPVPTESQLAMRWNTGKRPREYHGGMWSGIGDTLGPRRYSS